MTQWKRAGLCLSSLTLSLDCLSCLIYLFYFFVFSLDTGPIAKCRLERLLKSFPTPNHPTNYMYPVFVVWIVFFCWVTPHMRRLWGIKAAPSSPAQMQFYFPCQFSPELIGLPHSFPAPLPFVLPVQKIISTGCRFFHLSCKLTPMYSQLIIHHVSMNSVPSPPQRHAAPSSKSHNSVFSFRNPIYAAIQTVWRILITYGLIDSLWWNKSWRWWYYWSSECLHCSMSLK